MSLGWVFMTHPSYPQNLLFSMALALAIASGVVGCGPQDRTSGQTEAPSSSDLGDSEATTPGADEATDSNTSSETVEGAESSPNEESTAFAEEDVEQTVEITANDQMKFNINAFEVGAGEVVKITLKNIGSMPKLSMGHNVVILKQDADLDAFVQEAMVAPTNDYIPPERTDEIVARTKMTGGGETDSVIFKAPDESGEYVFLCSFPGHYQIGMKGIMTVN